MEIIIISAIFVLGISVGSFLNVLIDRLPNDESVLIGRSHCDYCKKTLRWFELIPLFSYILQRGKCLRCHKKLSWQYPLVELVTGISLVLIYKSLNISQEIDGLINFKFWSEFVIYSGIYSSLFVIFLADLKYQIIPDSMLLLATTCVVINLAVLNNLTIQQFNNLLSAILAALFFFLLWLFTKGKAMGFGDVKLAFLMGLLLGFPGIIIALYIAFLTGAAIGVILILSGNKTLKSRVPFGPFLIAGTLIALKWNQVIIEWWKGVL